MILACDIGNTSITIGIFKGRRLMIKSGLLTARAGQFKPFLNKTIKKRGLAPAKIMSAAICSVVPRLNEKIKKAIQAVIGGPVRVLGEDLEVPIKNLYAEPRQVGQDRLVCAFAAARLYGVPVISIDLGTAITFDVVSKDREYLGGVILPGLGLSLAALHNHTALLPEIKVARARALIGRDTRTSMLSGITYGFGSMIDGLIDRLKEELGKKIKTVATGGDSLFIRRYCGRIDCFDPDLVLKGIAELALCNQGRKP